MTQSNQFGNTRMPRRERVGYQSIPSENKLSKMAEKEKCNEQCMFLNSGIYRFEGSSNIIFIDPVRVFNCCYTRFRISPSAYYSRFFESEDEDKTRVSENSKKRKRNKKQHQALNERELSADQRHQEARPLLLRAHEALLGCSDLLSFLCDLKSDGRSSIEVKKLPPCVEEDVELSFIELGSVWQAPLYEISLYSHPRNNQTEDGGSPVVQYGEQKVIPIFNSLVMNETTDDVEAEFLNNWYIIPRESCFYMSDLEQIHDLIPARPDQGFNLIVIDPPWENRSALQKSVYPTLPNRYLLSLPIKQLAHMEGALVALWVTNREKLRNFIEKELFPMWGVSYMTTLYWLKVKADGSLISDLDLFHHRPYECLLLGYSHIEEKNSECLSTFRNLQKNQVMISIPGAYSRKPPVGKLLLDYAPGPKPVRCIELFARELLAGWTSWGNEPLHFQDSRYFLNKSTDELCTVKKSIVVGTATHHTSLS